MFVYFLLFFSLVFSTPLPLISTRDVTKRRERKMRLLFCGKNFNGAKVVLATTTTRKTTNLFSRRCFCSSARCCSPCLSFGKKKSSAMFPKLGVVYSAYPPPTNHRRTKTTATTATTPTLGNCSTKTTDRTFSETDTICGNRSNEI